MKTPARVSRWTPKWTRRTIYNRKRQLMAIQRKISRARNRRSSRPRIADVLVEGPSADSELVWQARLSTQAPEIDGVCYISDPGEAPLRAGRDPHACASPRRTITI